jgi:hypothetical protein
MQPQRLNRYSMPKKIQRLLYLAAEQKKALYTDGNANFQKY